MIISVQIRQPINRIEKVPEIDEFLTKNNFMTIMTIIARKLGKYRNIFKNFRVTSKQTKVSKIIRLRVFYFSIHLREGTVKKETKLYRFSLLFLFFKISYSIKIKQIAKTDSLLWKQTI